MKKRVLLIAAIAVSVISSTDVNAQDYKPAGGEKNVEVNFAPLGGNPISINSIRLRSFQSSTMAYRLGINLAYSNENDDPTYAGPDADNDGLLDEELVDSRSNFGITLTPGFENHWAGTDRLSPYWGGVLTIGYSRTSETDERYGILDLSGTDTTAGVFENETTDGNIRLGLNLVLGADWYFTKHMYMGTEVGFGFLYTNTSNTEFEYGQTLPDNVSKATYPDETERGNEFNIGPNFNSSIRLGFLF